MADPFVAEIRIFGFDFAPKGWASCDGQVLPLAQNTTLFRLLGTAYGGNGNSTFALPDMRGNVPVSQGSSVTGSDYALGQHGGSVEVTLLQSEIPVHSHGAVVSGAKATVGTPNNQMIAEPSGAQIFGAFPGNRTSLAAQALSPGGSNFPHNNMMPYLTFNFCIALQGIFPLRG
jgi:microcystin-dependent protein